jgi:hypothetical protein
MARANDQKGRESNQCLGMTSQAARKGAAKVLGAAVRAGRGASHLGNRNHRKVQISTSCCVNGASAFSAVAVAAAEPARADHFNGR